jgi:hypothetical protein
MPMPSYSIYLYSIDYYLNSEYLSPVYLRTGNLQIKDVVMLGTYIYSYELLRLWLIVGYTSS